MLAWQAQSSLLQVSLDGKTVTHTGHQNEYAAAVAPPAMVSDKHAFTFTIVKSRFHDGAGMLLGVVDATGEELGTAYGFLPLKGQMFTVRTDTEKTDKGTPRKRVTPDVGEATGATVRVEVDLEQSRMTISVNGAPPEDAGVELPKKIIPWMRLNHAGDSVTISDYEGPAHHRSLLLVEAMRAGRNPLSVDDVGLSGDVLVSRTFERVLPVKVGHRISWRFQILRGFFLLGTPDMLFSVEMIRDSEGSERGLDLERQMVVEPTMVSARKGEVSGECSIKRSGVLVIRWDNGHSWIRTKLLRFEVAERSGLAKQAQDEPF